MVLAPFFDNGFVTHFLVAVFLNHNKTGLADGIFPDGFDASVIVSVLFRGTSLLHCVLPSTSLCYVVVA